MQWIESDFQKQFVKSASNYFLVTPLGLTEYIEQTTRSNHFLMIF